MRSVKVLSLSLLVATPLMSAQQNIVTQVYQANAGSSPQSAQTANPAVQLVQGTAQQSQAQQPQNNNIFLQYYARQGSEFSASVFTLEKGNLAKKDISSDNLQKSVVIFFADWCPHCHRFLTDFSKHIKTLNSNGVKVILLHLPAQDKLTTWQDPVKQDYDAAKNSLQNLGISLSKNVQLVLLGDRATLTKTGVSGLPVFVAVKNSKEYYRGVGDKDLAKLQLGDANVLKQFLEIWGGKQQASATTKDGGDKQDGKTSSKHKGHSSVDLNETGSYGSLDRYPHPKISKKARKEADMVTEMLNSIFFGNASFTSDLNKF